MKRGFDASTVGSLLVIGVACAVVGWRVVGNGSTDQPSRPPELSATQQPERAANEAPPGDAEGAGSSPHIAEASTSDADAGAPFEYRLAKPDQTYTLDAALNEVSDLSLADDQESLWAVSDEKGTLYRVSVKDGSVLQTIEFHKKGDFEGVATANGQVVAARSDGELFVVDPRTGTSTHFSTSLGIGCNLEGLAYDSHTSRLLMACKSPQGDKPNRTWSVYSFDLENRTLDKKPALIITRKAVEAYLAQHSKDQDVEGIIAAEVDPSGIALQPKTGLFFVISTRGRLLMVLDASGTLLRMEKLDREVHLQPEGIAFGADGTLFLSNEARGRTPLLHRFVPQVTP